MLTTTQILQVMLQTGFPPVVAVTMTAIALRESGGNPYAFNGNTATGDRSYGLLQINMLALESMMGAFGITKEKQLFNPATNARAGFVLWGGNNANLGVAWYIDRPGYQEAYESHLPAAQSAMLGLM